jgi:hypothetical protein
LRSVLCVEQPCVRLCKRTTLQVCKHPILCVLLLYFRGIKSSPYQRTWRVMWMHVLQNVTRIESGARRARDITCSGILFQRVLRGALLWFAGPISWYGRFIAAEARCASLPTYITPGFRSRCVWARARAGVCVCVCVCVCVRVCVCLLLYVCMYMCALCISEVIVSACLQSRD